MSTKKRTERADQSESAVMKFTRSWTGSQQAAEWPLSVLYAAGKLPLGCGQGPKHSGLVIASGAEDGPQGRSFFFVGWQNVIPGICAVKIEVTVYSPAPTKKGLRMWWPTMVTIFTKTKITDNYVRRLYLFREWRKEYGQFVWVRQLNCNAPVEAFEKESKCIVGLGFTKKHLRKSTAKFMVGRRQSQ